MPPKYCKTQYCCNFFAKLRKPKKHCDQLASRRLVVVVGVVVVVVGVGVGVGVGGGVGGVVVVEVVVEVGVRGVVVVVIVVVVVVVVVGTRRGKNPPEHDTHVLQCLKVLAGAVNLRLGEILYRPVFGSKFGSKNEAMQDFVASFLCRPSATAEVLHVQLATPIVKCEPAWKLRKINVALMFNHKRSHPRTLAACGIMSIMMFFFAAYIVITIKILWTLCGLYCHYHHGIIASIWIIMPLSS